MFINEDGYGDEFFTPPSQEHNLAKYDRDPTGTAEKPNCNKCLFSSQETPPAATFTQDETAEVQNIISPNTLRKVVSDQVKVPLQEKKKGRARKKKGANRESNKDYTNIKKVLYNVLSAYSKSGGTFKKQVTKYDMHMFTHVTKFACVKQPPGCQKDAYYTLHHMRAFVRDQQQLMLPVHLENWAARLSEIQDADLRQEFFRIQSDLAGIIREDVLRNRGSSTSTINRPTVT